VVSRRFSIRPSNVTALRYNNYGELKKLQIEGGVNSGNSGGPIVDAEGFVIGVTVSVTLDLEHNGAQTQLANAVPTEFVHGLVSGRISHTEFEQPYNKDGKVRVPVKMEIVDPLGRFNKAGIGIWIGDTATKIRPPGLTRTGMLPSDKNYTLIDLNYDSTKKIATGELVYESLPPGLAYWVQPFYSNTKVVQFWTPGTLLPVSGPPVDRVATSLRVSLRPGTVRPITLSKESTASEFF